jgi:hypothetical protein
MPAAATAAAAAPGPLTQLALNLLAVMASNIQQTSSTAGLCQHGHSGSELLRQPAMTKTAMAVEAVVPTVQVVVKVYLAGQGQAGRHGRQGYGQRQGQGHCTCLG